MSRAPLAPHVAAPKYKLIRSTVAPVVIIAPEALAKMGYYVGMSADEVGWLGTVTRTLTGPNLPDLYQIHDVFMLEQAVSAGTTEIDPEAITTLAMDMINADGTTERAESLLLWGHSHVNMGTSPSGQDDAQMNTFAQNNPPFMLRLIANKAGRVAIYIYDYSAEVIWLDVSWRVEVVEDDALQAEIAAELKAKVRKITYAYAGAATGGARYGSGAPGYSTNAPVARNPMTGAPVQEFLTAEDLFSDVGWEAEDQLGASVQSWPDYVPPEQNGIPFLLSYDTHTKDLLMPSGRKPDSLQDWKMIEPFEEAYESRFEYLADMKLWERQYAEWSFLNGTPNKA